MDLNSRADLLRHAVEAQRDAGDLESAGLLALARLRRNDADALRQMARVVGPAAQVTHCSFSERAVALPFPATCGARRRS